MHICAIEWKKMQILASYLLSSSGFLGSSICFPLLILVKNPNQLIHLTILVSLCGSLDSLIVYLADKQLKTFKADRTVPVQMFAGLAFGNIPGTPIIFRMGFMDRISLSVGRLRMENLLLIPLILYIFLSKITGVPFVEARKLEASGKTIKIISNKLIPSFWFSKK